MKPLSVLVLSNLYPTHEDPARGSFVKEQVELLAARGVDLTVIAPGPVAWRSLKLLRTSTVRRWLGRPRSARPTEQLVRTRVEGLVVRRPGYVQPSDPNLQPLTYAEACLREARQIVRIKKFDVIHAHTGVLDGFAASLLKRWLRIPYVLTEHSGPFRMTSSFGRKLSLRTAYQNADRVIAVSRALADEIGQFLEQERVPAIDVIPNGYRQEVFGLDPTASPHVARSKRYVLFVGYFNHNKGLDTLRDAFSQVVEKLPDVELHLVGRGTDVEELERWVKSEPFGSKVRIHASIMDRDTVALYMQNRCDVLVLPSRYETFGLVLIEAMACGKPVIATRCGGPNEIVDERVGKLVDVAAPDQLAAAMIDVLQNLDRYPVEALSRLAQERFGQEVLGDRILATLKETAGGR